MNYMWDERMYCAHIPRPVPTTRLADVQDLIGPGDTVIGVYRFPVLVLSLVDYYGISAQAKCQLPDGENYTLMHIYRINGHLHTMNHPGNDPGWVPVTIVHRADRQLQLMGVPL